MNTTESRSVFVTVAPNGARHGKADHPGIPISPRELAETAVTCAEAGAAMIHLHVRDRHGRHSLEPEHYRPAIREIRQAVGDTMLIQVTSEAAGVYGPGDQMRLIEALAPGGVSIAIRELFSDGADADRAARLLITLRELGSMVQYILYSDADIRQYRDLVADGVIPHGRHLVLFALGRDADTEASSKRLREYVTTLENAAPWMVCAFGHRSFDILTAAALADGHVRIGFENGWLLPDSSVAADNAALVRTMAQRIHACGCRVATVAEAQALYSE